jgi:hypothetical protein
LGIGDGDWGLGIGDWAQSPIPNPQSPIPNPQSPLYYLILIEEIKEFNHYYIFLYLINYYNINEFFSKLIIYEIS